MRMQRLLLTAALVLVLGVPRSAWAGEVIVQFFAAPGTGFADPTPVAPVGGNPGTTLGEQRINVFLQAAAIWTEKLQPAQDIFVAAQFQALAPGVLGSAGAQFIWANFPGAELPNTWFFDALADHHSQSDLSPPTFDIIARFSSNFPFYLGFDNNDPPGTADLLAVVLHEIGHGLNFANAVNESTGTIPIPAGQMGPFGDIYSQYTVDVTTNKIWNDMTDAERAASAINARKVSWNGLHVNLNKHRVLERGEPAVRVTQPSSLGTLMLGTAAFGPALTATGVTGSVVAATDAADAVGPLTTDACSPIQNVLTGQIALVDRGTCGFIVKVKNAQDAGAIAVLVADNTLNLPPPGLGGADPLITIPSGRISQADGAAIRAALSAGAVNVRMFLDRSVLAGTDRVKGQVMVNATNPVQPGSSISHWDPVTFPNQLMEPAINADLTSELEPPLDLTLPLLTDLGWFTDRDGVLDGKDLCLGSNTSPTVVIGACDSGVPNVVRSTGCTFSDLVDACAPLDATDHRAYRACVFLATLYLRLDGAITTPQMLAINSCTK
jgi:hypothetical protein